MIPDTTKKSTFAIVGPTASGKSDVAIALAKKHDGEIISADSRQIYRGMTIGSGKVPGVLNPVLPENFSSPAPQEAFVYISENIPHWMIDILDPNTPYSAAQFSKRAKIIANNIAERNKLPIICGGTGYWAQALIENTPFPEVSPNETLRKELSAFSTETLFQKLEILDTERAKTIDQKNKVRIIRAIEIALAIGKVPKIKNSPTKSISSDTNNSVIIALNPPREILYENIEKRLDARIETGMIEEISELHHTGVSWKRLENFGLEYRWGARYLQKFVTREEMRTQLLNDIRHYAKRQITWLKRWEHMERTIHWAQNQKEAMEKAMSLLEKY